MVAGPLRVGAARAAEDVCERAVGTVGRGGYVEGLVGIAFHPVVSGLYLPVGIWVLWHHRPTPAALGCALMAGVLSSAVPFLADLLALRRVPAHFFGVFMSVNPVFAALVGLAVLGQRLDALAWLAIAVIVTANTAAVSTTARKAA